MRVDDVAGNGPGRNCPPRHRMPFNPSNEGSDAMDDVAGNILSTLARGATARCALARC